MSGQLEHRIAAGSTAGKLATLRALPSSDLMLIGICWLMIGTASLLIALLPSRLILRSLGTSVGPVARAPAISPRQQRRLERIARAIGIAARHAPFRADCYPQALTAARLCRWFAIPHALHLGARFAAVASERFGRLEGHAWVSSGTIVVCGGPASDRRFGTVACFVHVPAPDRARRPRAD